MATRLILLIIIEFGNFHFQIPLLKIITTQCPIVLSVNFIEENCENTQREWFNFKISLGEGGGVPFLNLEITV